MVLEKVKAVMSECFNLEEGEITNDMSIDKDLNADSLDIADFIMALEGEFNIDIPNNDIENIKTVNQLVDYIKKKSKRTI
ncbi:MAG: acyl carrier protein [Oscillospiraceae bacterium]|nr:acyl carrier protein [Oscillospiraceae bacterium]